VHLQEIFAIAVESVAEYFSYPLAWIGTVTDQKNLSIQRVKGDNPIIRNLLEENCIHSCLCPQLNEALNRNELVVLQDIQELDSCTEFQEKIIHLGYRTILYLPLVVKGKIFGILAAYQTRPHAFTSTELAYLQTFANLTSIAIEKSIFLQTVQDSEKKYSQVVEQARDGIFLIQDGKFRFVNKSFAKILKYSVDELEGRPFQFVLSPQSLPIVSSRYKKRLRGEKVPSVYRISAIRKDGVEIPIELSISLIHYQNQPALLVVAHDLSEEEKAIKALRESESRYRKLFENALIGITQFFPDGSLLTANHTWYAMLKYPNPEELINVNLRSLFEDPAQYDEMMRCLEEKDVLTDFESRMKCRDGSVIAVLSNIRTERDASGQVRFYEGIHQDITHRKQLEQELVQV
jgi:PAS domain S-box-containing protein